MATNSGIKTTDSIDWTDLLLSGMMVTKRGIKTTNVIA
jgi:hypothetical protein